VLVLVGDIVRKILKAAQKGSLFATTQKDMITKEQVMPLLLEACPSFTEKWRAHSADWQDESLIYIDLAEFNRHLIELQRNKRVEEFAAVFDVVEKLHLEGDDYVREAATIGLLEGIQNVASHPETGVDAEDFLQYLKAESAKWWHQLNDFWEGKIPYVGASINKA
jgi:hypothetical protein